LDSDESKWDDENVFAAARLATKDLSPPLIRTAQVPVGTYKKMQIKNTHHRPERKLTSGFFW
jgi:hypothetical protein